MPEQPANSLYVDPYFQSVYDQSVTAKQAEAPVPFTQDQGLGAPTEKIPFILSDGSYAELTPDAAMQATRLGGRVASPEESTQARRVEQLKKTYESDPLATGAALASGFVQDAVPGGAFLMRKGLTAMGLDEQEASNRLLALREASPIASFTGSAASAFVPNPLGKAAGALGHLAEAGAGKVAGKAAGWVAKQALEGGAYGANAAFNEDVLNNHPLQAERLFHGAIVGGALQTALGVPFAAGQKALSRTFGKGAAEAAEKATGAVADTLVPDQATEAIAKNQGIDLPMAGEQFTGPLEKKWWYPTGSEAMREKGAALSVSSPGATVEGNKLMAFDPSAAGEEARFIGSQAPKLLEQAARGTKQVLDKVIDTSENKIFDILKGESRPASYAPLVKDVDVTLLKKTANDALGEIAVLEKLASTPNMLSATAKRVADSQIREFSHITDKLNHFIAVGDKGGIAAVTDDVRKALGRQAKWLEGQLLASSSGKQSLFVHEEGRELWQATRDAYDRMTQIQRNPAMVGDKLAAAIDDINAPWSAALDAKTKLQARGYLNTIEGSGDQAFWRSTTMTPEASQALANNYGAFVKEGDRQALSDYVSNITNAAKMMETHFGETNPELRKHVQDLADLQQVMGQLDKQMEGINLRRDQFAGLGGQLNLFESAARGVGTAVGSGLGMLVGSPALGGGMGYAASSALGGMLNAGKRAGQMLGIETLSRNAAKREAQVAQKLVSGSYVPTVNNVTTKTYPKFAEKIRALASNPALIHKAASAAIEGLSVAAPKIAMESALKTQQAVQYLSSTLPPQASTNILQPQFENPKPMSDMALTQLNRRVNAIVDPMSVYQNPTREGVEAVKAVYPQIHLQMQNNVIEAISSATSPVNFNVRQRLGMLFGITTDQFSDPMRWAELQSALAQQAGQASQGGQKPKGSVTAHPLDTVQYSMTTKLEMGASK